MSTQAQIRQSEATDEIVRLRGVLETLISALLVALPFVEDHEDSEVFRKHVVKRAAKQVRDALAEAGAA